MEFERKAKKLSDIRVIPLIDVVFFLIFYFLVAGSVQQFAVVAIDPPMAESGKPLREGPAVFTFGRFDEILFNDEPVAESDIIVVAKKALAADPARIVTVKMDATLPAATLVDMIDRMKLAGVKNLSLLTQSP